MFTVEIPSYETPQMRCYLKKKAAKVEGIVREYRLDDIARYISAGSAKDIIQIKVPREEFGEFWTKIVEAVKKSPEPIV